MASDLFQSVGASEANNAQVQQQQNPRNAAIALMKQQGISVPENIANNPQAIIQHIVQSGAVPQNRLQMAQQVMQRMFRR